MKKKDNKKKAYMESKTVMMINPAIMTTSIPLYMKIQMVRLQRAVEMSRFGNWKNTGFSPTSILPLLLLYIASVTISKET